MKRNYHEEMSKKSLLGTIRDLRNELRMTRNIFNVEDLAAYTGLTIAYIYKLTSARVIPHYKPLNKTLFFKKSEIDEWLLSNPVNVSQLKAEYLNKLNNLRSIV